MDKYTNLLNKAYVNVPMTIICAVLIYYVGRIIIYQFIKSSLKTTARQKAWHKKDLSKRRNTLNGITSSVWRIFVIIMTSFFIFKEIFPNTSLAPIFASAGIVGVAIGFGAQSLAKDFLSGVFIISENQYRVGDIIEISGFTGTVERIGARSTVMRDPDGNVHYFPNGMIQHVINKTMGFSMSRFVLAIDPNENVEQIIEIINNIGAKLAKEKSWKDKIIDPPAYTSMGEISAHAVDITVAGKVQPSDQWAVSAEMRKRILEEFEKNKIKLGSKSIVPSKR